MKQIRLVALDLDGTVFNDQKEITPRTLGAIRAALEQGVTGLRPPGALPAACPNSSPASPACGTP